MQKPSLPARITSLVLVAALIVLAPGLPFYTAFALDPVAITSSGVSWSTTIGRFATGFNPAAGAAARFSPASSGKMLSRIKGVNWHSPAGQNLADAIGKRLEQKQVTAEAFDAMPAEDQQALLEQVAEEDATAIQETAAQTSAQSGPSAVMIRESSERTDTRVRSIAKSLGQSFEAPSINIETSKTKKIETTRPLTPSFGRTSPVGRGSNAIAMDAPKAKPSVATRIALVAQKAIVSLTPVALAAMPWIAQFQPSLDAGMASAVAAFALGALAAKDVAKDVLKNTKLSGKAYSGALTLAVMGGGAVAVGATLALAAFSPTLAGAAITTVAIGGAMVARANTPKKALVSDVHINSGRAGETPLFDIVKVSGQDGITVRHFMKLRKDQLGKPFLLYAMLDEAPGEKQLYASWLAGDFLATFKQTGDTIELVAKNTRYQAAKGSPLERTFEKSIPDSVMARAKVVAYDKATGDAVISLDELFGQDILDLNTAVDAGFKAPYALDASANGVDAVKAFAENIKVTSRLNFSGRARTGTQLPDPSARNVSLKVSYSLLAMPQESYTPRKADDRIGFFTTTFQDWTDGQKRELTTRFVNRWKLEKKDPSAALSEPKQPIVYWLENTIPVEYRGAVTRAILEWNQAFEKIGFKNAIVVKQQPDPADSPAAPVQKRLLARLAALLPASVRAQEAKTSDEEYFDPADARFNVIRWFMNSDDYVLAIGPSRANPYTGQLINAGIAFHAAFTRPGGVLEMSGIDDPLDKDSKAAKKDKKHQHTAACNHGPELARQAAQAMTVLEARGTMTAEERKRFVEDFIAETVVHEVGHTLGLRHNFAASTWLKPEEMAGKDPFSASVMDYNSPNLAGPGEKQGPFFQTHLGPYDFKAIEYAYKPLEGMNAQQQDKALGDIAASVSADGLAYATDEDVTGMDPKAQPWDGGNDPVAFAQKQIAIVRDLWDRLEKQQLKDGEGYQRLTRAFLGGFRYYYRAVDAAVKNIGGISYNREHAGNAKGRVPFEPVSPAEQLKTIQFLDQYVFSDEMLKVSPELLKKLAPERLPTLNDPYPVLGYIPYNQMVLAIRLAALDHIFDPEVIERLTDTRHMAGEGDKVVSAAGVLEMVTNSIWYEIFVEQPQPAQEAQAGQPHRKRPVYAISALRRELQMAYIDRLIMAAFSPRSGTEGSAMAQNLLMGMQAMLKKSIKEGSWDMETQAHLMQALQKTVHGLEMGPMLVRGAAVPHRGGKDTK